MTNNSRFLSTFQVYFHIAYKVYQINLPRKKCTNSTIYKKTGRVRYLCCSISTATIQFPKKIYPFLPFQLELLFFFPRAQDPYNLWQGSFLSFLLPPNLVMLIFLYPFSMSTYFLHYASPRCFLSCVRASDKARLTSSSSGVCLSKIS